MVRTGVPEGRGRVALHRQDIDRVRHHSNMAWLVGEESSLSYCSGLEVLCAVVGSSTNWRLDGCWVGQAEERKHSAEASLAPRIQQRHANEVDQGEEERLAAG